MKTTRLAWTTYKLRLWAGLAALLLVACGELWMASRVGPVAPYAAGTNGPVARADIGVMFR